jgi:hypothetical protein
MVKLERDIIKQIQQRLGVYQCTGEVEWFSRMNSGNVKTSFGSYIKLCERGTPDFLALVNGKEGLIALFIEAKSESGTLRPEQLAFMTKYQSHPYINMIVVKDIEKLNQFIDLYAVDRTKEMDGFNLTHG